MRDLFLSREYSLAQVKEFKYLGVLFASEGTMEREIGRRIGAAGAVLRSLYRTVVTKRELSRKAKLSIYRSIFVPILTYGHEGWEMAERTRSRVQAAERQLNNACTHTQARTHAQRRVVIGRVGKIPCGPLTGGAGSTSTRNQFGFV